ncbi:MAG: sugar kinase [Actinobacteria bacterium]|nr:sugar kinase [Actinomycetota bacterium]MCL5447404.1 sugar kinase [Actinomycetota bacterium]
MCRYDLVSLGEVMLRLDPGEHRIEMAKSFEVWEGGGEYNVAKAISSVFGMRSAIVTALVDNPVGHLIERLMLQGRIDSSFVQWRAFDDVGLQCRNGINFTERGFGVRAAHGVADRGHSAASQIAPDEVDWKKLFGAIGVRWFHTGGIYAALSESTPEVIATACKVASSYGTVISYDLNYRASLWRANGGEQWAHAVNRNLVKKVDVLFGNEEDFRTSLGIDIPGVNDIDGVVDWDIYRRAYSEVIDEVRSVFPNVKGIMITLRRVKSASRNDWGAIGYWNDAIVEVPFLRDMDIMDRIGGGDGFASGFIYALLAGKDGHDAIRYGIAHGALAMTTPGDSSMATIGDVERLVGGQSPRVIR